MVVVVVFDAFDAFVVFVAVVVFSHHPGGTICCVNCNLLILSGPDVLPHRIRSCSCPSTAMDNVKYWSSLLSINEEAVVLFWLIDMKKLPLLSMHVNQLTVIICKCLELELRWCAAAAADDDNGLMSSTLLSLLDFTTFRFASASGLVASTFGIDRDVDSVASTDGTGTKVVKKQTGLLYNRRDGNSQGNGREVGGGYIASCTASWCNTRMAAVMFGGAWSNPIGDRPFLLLQIEVAQYSVS